MNIQKILSIHILKYQKICSGENIKDVAEKKNNEKIMSMTLGRKGKN